jgi:DNA repair protein RadC
MNEQIPPLQRCIGGDDVRSLSDSELLAVILGTGSRDTDVFQLSLKVLRQSGGLPGLRSSGIREIAMNRGIGLRKAVRIHAAFELGRRVISNPSVRNMISSPAAVWHLLLPEIACLENENFWVIVLNNKNQILKKTVISVGTVSEAIVHPREVFRDAIREGGSSIIIAHNHPSGSTVPSNEDIDTSRRILEAGRIVGIHLLDHIILTNSSYQSMKEGGYL